MSNTKTRPTPPISDDNEPINHDRAGWAQQTLNAFMAITGVDADTALHDLLCDLMHFCRFNTVDFSDELEDASVAFEREVADTE